MMPNNFYEPLEAGWWIQWAVENIQRQHPTYAITAFSEIFGRVCGSVPNDWNGKVLHVFVNDEKLQEWLDWADNRKKIGDIR
jgi:hypothetical protein